MAIASSPAVQPEPGHAGRTSAGPIRWATSFGGEVGDRGTAVAFTPDGGVIVGGYVQGTAVLGTNELTARGSSDAFVAALDGDSGEVTWARTFGSRSSDTVHAVALLPDADIIVAGDFHHELTADEHTLVSAGNRDAFLARLAGANGDILWIRRVGGPHADSLTDVAVTAEGDIVVTGFFRGDASFGGATLSSSGEADIVVASYAAADGAHRWSRRLGDAGEDRCYALALDRRDNLYLASYEAVRDRAPKAVRGHVTKLDPAGTTQWNTEIGVADVALVPWAIAPHPNGDLFLAGAFRGKATLLGTAATPNGKWDAFVGRLRGDDGAPVWLRSFGAGGSDKAYDLAIDGRGRPIVAAQVVHDIAYDDVVLEAIGPGDTLLLGLDARTGARAWHHRIGGGGPTLPRAITVSPRFGIVATGDVYERAAFGAHEVQSAGLADVLVTRWSR